MIYKISFYIDSDDEGTDDMVQLAAAMSKGITFDVVALEIYPAEKPSKADRIAKEEVDHGQKQG